MQIFEIIHHGGKDCVTGSCHELRVAADCGVLIDCGLFQGNDGAEGEGSVDRVGPEAIDFPIGQLRALVLTHVHLDHCGRIPQLLAAGFKGPIFCSAPSATLLPLMLEDALKVGVTRDQGRIERIIRQLQMQLVPLAYGEWRTIPGGSDRLAVRLQPAGHILGSAYVECRIAGRTRVIFSGDLGPPHTPLIQAPKAPSGCDVLVLESTYGDRLHEGRKGRRLQLQGVIEAALRDRGTILVPAFALGRTQELLYELEEIIDRNRGRFAAKGLPWEELEIIVDSPLASRFTAAYRDLKPFWDAEGRSRLRAGRHPLSFEQMTTIDRHEDHLQAVEVLRRRGRPCVVIAAGGMCSGGRIVDYLKALLGDLRSDVLLVGYQAKGTPGRAIQTYGPKGGYVLLDGEQVGIRARVHTLSGYSAHADQRNLVDFVTRMRRSPLEVRLVHGEPEVRRVLAERLGTVFDGQILV